MPKATRYYYSPEFPEGITRSAFRRLRREQKLEVMRSWFGQHYEDPAQRTPYESREGGYQWIWGGPYDAREELESEFGGLAPEKLIEELVEELEQEGTEWAPTPSDGDYDDDRDDRDEYIPDADDEWPPIVVDQRPELDPLVSIANKLEFGLVPRYGNPEELAARAAIISDLEQIEAELDRSDRSGSMIGHNHPPEPIESTTIAIAEDDEKKVKDAVAVLKAELKSDKPDAAEVVSKTRVLRDVFVSVTKWVGKKADVGIDEFIKSYMKSAGTAAGVVTIPVSIAGATGKLGSLVDSIASTYSGIVSWLQTVLSMAF